VSYSTLRYRHDREFWEKWFPAKLICESLPGQFRNWFYAMLAMSTIMEQRTPFKACFGYGLVLGENGREMHKSWGNAIDFDEAAENMGADVMRWMYCKTRPETNLLFGYTRAEEIQRQFLIPLWNIYSFFVTYANLDKWTPKNTAKQESLSLLDHWILSKLNMLVKEETKYLERFDPYSAAAVAEVFVEELSTWYVRRSRRRFWKSEKDEDKNAAYTTLYKCLTTLVELLAPFIPFTAEEMYQNLVKSVDSQAHESVHHNDWPAIDEHLIDEQLMENMGLAIKVCSLGRSARSKAEIKLRQPLSFAKVAAELPVIERIRAYEDIIVDELNVKELSFTTEREELIEYTVKPLPQALGKKYGRLLPKIGEALAKTDAKSVAKAVGKGEPVKLKVGRKKIELLPDELEVVTKPKKGYALSDEEEGVMVAVNIEITEELRQEGLARDIVRRIQNQRKEAGFNISDLIETYYQASSTIAEVFRDFGDYIAAETLSSVLCEASLPKGAHVATYKIDGEPLKVGLKKVDK
jgi:isoleucyl-tRNA synthetase